MANLSVNRFPSFDLVDDLLRSLRPLRGQQDAQPMQIRIDVTENNESFAVRAEMSGVRKEDINVAVDGARVEISAEVKNEKEVKGAERILRTERYYGTMYRAFSLPQEIAESSVQARYTDGVLEVTLPKKAPAPTRRITIN